MEMQAFQPLVGEWAIEIDFPGHDGVIGGRTTFEWLEGGGYLIQRSVVDDPRFPRGVMVFGPDVGGERIVQHYFDSRGIARIYDVSFEDGVLRLWRDDDDFAQRYAGRLSADGRTVDGTFERSDDGVEWLHDFDLTYTKVS
jgi:hypothetical protein